MESDLNMDDADREKITTNLNKLVLRTTWNDKLELSLIEKKTFSSKSMNLIKTSSDQDEWIRQLYFSIQKRGPKAFDHLVRALVESGNSVAANILDCSIEIESLPSPIKDDVNK